MRSSFLRLLNKNNLAGFYETLTVFWMKLLQHLSVTHYGNVPLWQRINAIVASHGTKWPIEAHYSKEVVASQDAREQWAAPDLRPIPF